MSADTTGKVIITAIADAAAREKVVAFVCSNSGAATPDLVRAKLEKLPMVLAGAIETPRGERLATILTAMGATAAFIAADTVPTPPAQPPPADNDGVPSSAAEQPRAERPATGRKPGTRPPREKSAPTAAEESYRIGLACRIVLFYALLACLVAMVSPLFAILSLPMALYAAHRAVALLGDSLWLRSVFLPGVFVPGANIVILALLFLRIILFLRRSTIAPDAVRDELAPVRFVLRAGYAGFMAMFLFGTANGYLPASMDELRESIEHLLEKTVARSAKDFPRTVNKNLRIDNMAAGPGKRLTFNCTLQNYPAKAVDAELFRTGIKGNIVKEVCASKEMCLYLKKEVIVAYSFNGNDNLPIATVDVAQADCNN